jgi:diadenosine tetraphosphatase ApaH/serine/threonine PP2A family protein phosphatase
MIVMSSEQGPAASSGQLVCCQLLDSLDVSGAAVEATADVGVVGAIGSPFQDPALHRAQFLRFWRDARAGYPCVGDHSPDELWAAPEATGDLVLIDTVVDQSQDATFERPQ